MTSRPTWRRRLTTATTLPLRALAAACGGSAAADDRQGAAATGCASAFPGSTEHTYGSTTVAQEPARAVTVRDWYGHQPSATWPWAPRRAAGADGDPATAVPAG